MRRRTWASAGFLPGALLPGALPGALLAAALLALALAQDDGWSLGRATHYGAPEAFAAAFNDVRGVGAFGILEYGSCGATNLQNGVPSLPFASDAVAALADRDKHYAGSCNRCYALRCAEGLVLGNAGRPINISTAEPNVEYLPSVTRDLTDSAGRPWPGNPAEDSGQLFTRCNEPGKQIVVRIIDTCPCIQVLPDGAPGVRPGGEVRTQGVCCGGPAGIDHFDIAFGAFEQLAHPLYGLMMLEYRTVDCDTGAPLPEGYVSRDVMYGSTGAAAGWGWFVYGSTFSQHAVPGQAPGGGAATCVQLTKGGAISFSMKQGGRPGLQPFAGATAVEFWIKSDAPARAPRGATATPAGEPVDVKVFVQNDVADKFCNAEPRTGNITPSATAPGGWRQLTIPFEAFRCDYDGALPSQVNRIDFQHTGELPALFCLAGLRLLR